MEMQGKVAIVTGAGSGIGKAVSAMLVERGAKVAMVDMSPSLDSVAAEIIQYENAEDYVAAYVGNVCDAEFRRKTFDDLIQHWGLPSLLVPCAGITRDSLAVKLDKETKKANIYPVEMFQQVLDVNLLAPTYWALEMVGRIAEREGRWRPDLPMRGSVVFIGSVISQGNKGQIAYSATKKALEAVAATMQKEAMFYGVRFGVVHPGYTNTPMVAAMGEELIAKLVFPSTQLKRLIRPEEIADAVCFMLANDAVSRELWVDAGWHPMP